MNDATDRTILDLRSRIRSVDPGLTVTTAFISGDSRRAKVDLHATTQRLHTRAERTYLQKKAQKETSDHFGIPTTVRLQLNGQDGRGCPFAGQRGPDAKCNACPLT